MTGSISLHMLPAGDGDCLLLQASDPAGAVTTTILVDGGRQGAYSAWKPIVQGLIGPRNVVDLVVVTHIDADHIGGILAMIGDARRGFDIGEVWFNGHRHVVAAQEADPNREAYGVSQADDLSDLIEKCGLPWNEAFAGGPIHRGTPFGKLRVGDFTVIVLTPGQRKLAAMLVPWTKAWEAAKKPDDASTPAGIERYGSETPDISNLAGAKDRNDTAKPNGSSIGLMMEAFGRRLLLSGDCHPEDMTDALAAIAPSLATPITVDVLKVSHHGARDNTTNAMLKSVKATTYAFSTDGSRHDHPDDHSVAKVIMAGEPDKTLAFNYRTSRTELWDNPRLKAEFGYETLYPDKDADGHLCLRLPGV